MGYNLIIKPGASLDIDDALEWYEEQREGLASELYYEIDKVIKIIEETPNLFQVRYRNVRIVFAERFPYGVHYTIEENNIFVHAVMKMQRNPKK